MCNHLLAKFMREHAQTPVAGGKRTPQGRRAADFEFHSQFCSVMKIVHSTIFLNGLLMNLKWRPVARLADGAGETFTLLLLHYSRRT